MNLLLLLIFFLSFSIPLLSQIYYGKRYINISYKKFLLLTCVTSIIQVILTFSIPFVWSYTTRSEGDYRPRCDFGIFMFLVLGVVSVISLIVIEGIQYGIKTSQQPVRKI